MEPTAGSTSSTDEEREHTERVEFNLEQMEAWIAKGAQLSPTVRSLIKRKRKRAAAAAS